MLGCVLSQLKSRILRRLRQMQVPYYQIIKPMKNKFNFRYHLVQFAKTRSVSQAACEFSATRKVVRKWISRFDQLGLRGLEDQSKAPHSCPHKLGASLMTIRSTILETNTPNGVQNASETLPSSPTARLPFTAS